MLFRNQSPVIPVYLGISDGLMYCMCLNFGFVCTLQGIDEFTVFSEYPLYM